MPGKFLISCESEALDYHSTLEACQRFRPLGAPTPVRLFSDNLTCKPTELDMIKLYGAPPPASWCHLVAQRTGRGVRDDPGRPAVRGARQGSCCRVIP